MSRPITVVKTVNDFNKFIIIANNTLNEFICNIPENNLIDIKTILSLENNSRKTSISFIVTYKK